jgi:thioredoxin-like negative regulator of GroEL
MLSFWGDWCPVCRTLFPHERSLVNKYAGRPFQLVGVNSDPNLVKLGPRLIEERINWRSFWNGPLGTSVGIAKQWQIQTWPTVVLIDETGVIRFKNMRSEVELEPAIERLVVEAERRAARAK